MNNRPRLFMIAGGICLLLVMGYYYFSISRPGIGIRWQQAPFPPEKLVVLRLVENGAILAQSNNKNIYQYLPGSIWKHVNSSAEILDPGMLCGSSDSKGFFILPPPGKVIAHVSEQCVATESGYHLEVVLLEDGEVWLWRYETSLLSGMVVGYTIFITLIFGMSLLLFGFFSSIAKKL